MKTLMDETADNTHIIKRHMIPFTEETYIIITLMEETGDNTHGGVHAYDNTHGGDR